MMNPFDERMRSFMASAKKRRLDAVLVFGQLNRRALTDVDCDNGILLLKREGAGFKVVFYTDFRYTAMLHRTAPWLEVADIWHLSKEKKAFRGILGDTRGLRIGYDAMSISASRYLALERNLVGAKLVDVDDDVLALRSVKTVDEIMRIAAAESLNDEIWRLAKREMKPGMTEKDIQRIIRAYMNALGDGEAFETIVCAGKNAAECHHVPDDTVWHRGEALLVDMGVKLNGVCSDMTRNIPAKNDLEYAKVYELVLKANKAAIAAARPGMKCRNLDGVARKIIADAGYGKAFGHSLGHGVGYEIHERPYANITNDEVLEPGMLVTIEPGVYLEGRLGVRIEDLVLITTTGCEVLSHSEKDIFIKKRNIKKCKL